jgi:hypothetical protein
MQYLWLLEFPHWFARCLAELSLIDIVFSDISWLHRADDVSRDGLEEK